MTKPKATPLLPFASALATLEARIARLEATPPLLPLIEQLVTERNTARQAAADSARELTELRGFVVRLLQAKR